MSLRDAIFSRHDPGLLHILQNSVVGIAGAGGLGSNAAVSLARAGVGRLIVADFDRIEPSNLNRQQYSVKQIGRQKAAALRDNIGRLNPFCAVEAHCLKVTAANTRKLFGGADLLIEAFDKAEQKAMLIRAWLRACPGKPVITASGLAGFGGGSALRVRRIGDIYACGDGKSVCPKGISPMAPRVAIVANLQADLAVELLVKLKGGKGRGR